MLSQGIAASLPFPSVVSAGLSGLMSKSGMATVFRCLGFRVTATKSVLAGDHAKGFRGSWIRVRVLSCKCKGLKRGSCMITYFKERGRRSLQVITVTSTLGSQSINLAQASHKDTEPSTLKQESRAPRSLNPKPRRAKGHESRGAAPSSLGRD